MTLYEFAEHLRAILVQNNGVQRVVNEIKNIRHENGTPLSDEEKQQFITYLQGRRYSPDGRLIITDSDNSAFIRLVQTVSQTLSKGGNEWLLN